MTDKDSAKKNMVAKNGEMKLPAETSGRIQPFVLKKSGSEKNPPKVFILTMLTIRVCQR
ncbi:MAG: hypothetical protein M0Q91_06230 [Methanoregula sp.]|nr:hypothetical protein [Methanoregula sp.]